MATVPAREDRRASRRWPVLVLLVAVPVGLRLLEPAAGAWLQTMLVVAGSLLVEAVPFVLLGAFVSAAIEVFVPTGVFTRIALLPRPLQLPAAAAAGIAFPVCECGSVPVARRLARRGLSPAAAVTFMFAAPVVNPVVIASTLVAYRGRDTQWLMVGGRFLLGFVVAMAVGWVVGSRRSEDLLRARADEEPEPEDPGAGRARRFVGHLSGDVLFMGRYLVVGATIAAAVQTLVPPPLLDGVAGLPVLSIVAMMVLAFVMSLCSESDAFVAASFVGFSPGAQLAFLVSGPMLDTKLAALYVGTFGRGFLRTSAVAVAAVTLALCLWVDLLW
jgi:uncharacterized protein